MTKIHKPSATLAKLFERQVLLTPDHIALEFGSESLSYNDLNARANQLARFLISKGVGAEVKVAFYLPRSLSMIVTMLGVLKAGGAYIPLDLKYPGDRLEWMCRDSDPKILIMEVGATLPFECHRSTLVIEFSDVLRDVLASYSPFNFDESEHPNPASAGNLAYVLYTSGSTGKPKGVAVTHTGIESLAVSQRWQLDLHAGCRVLQFASISFGAALWELCMALLSGATLVLAEPSALIPGRALESTIDDLGITHATLPGAALREMESDRCQRLHTLIVAGESCSQELIKIWSKGRAMFNAYGSTEMTVCATMSGKFNVTDAPVIGQTIADFTAYILDERFVKVKPGDVGELFIEGAGLARGYLNQSGLTSTRFVASPFGARGGRIYRTGDLVRQGRNGELDYVGRADHQISLRGYRIEPGEIEAELTRHADVQQAVVVGRKYLGNEVQIVAYVVLNESRKIDPKVGDIRKFLSLSLPLYMLPAAFVFIDKIPLTPNKKIDRAALPDPHFNNVDQREPVTDTELVLLSIFNEVLGLEAISVNDNFFELGGHSLLAVRLANRIKDRLNKNVDAGMVLEASTVAELARRMDGVGGVSFNLSAYTARNHIPLSAEQLRMWFLSKMEDGNTAYNVATAWRIGGVLDKQALQAALEDVVGRHEILRTIYPVKNMMPSQVVIDLQRCRAFLTLKEINTLEGEIQDLLNGELHRPFELDDHIPIRCFLLSTAKDSSVLIFVMHHIAVDARSLAILGEDLVEAYAARTQGQLPQWNHQSSSYSSYAIWQNEVVLGETDGCSYLAMQAEFWKRKLKKPPENVTVPLDYPRPGKWSNQADGVSFNVPADTLRGLRTLAKRSNASLFMLAQTALALLLWHRTGSEDVVFGFPVSVRTHTDLERIVGLFINTVVLRADLSGNKTVEQVISMIKAAVLEAHANQDFPFERVIEVVNPPRTANKHPLFQVMITHLNCSDKVGRFGEATIAHYPLHNLNAKFDITLNLLESADALVVDAEFAADLYERSTIEALLAQYVSILGEIGNRHNVRADELESLVATTRNVHNFDVNTHFLDSPFHSFIDRFEDQVVRSPDAVALIFAGKTYSYGEIDEKANFLAESLVEVGLKPGARVAILLERSELLVVAILAVLKTGAAYVPVDTEFPAERISYILDDASSTALLTCSNLSSLAVAHASCELILLDKLLAPTVSSGEMRQEIIRHARHQQSSPLDAAYILYTSGSTGKPKGVLVSNLNLANLIDAFADELSLGTKTILASTTISFDIAVLEVLLPLAQGGRLVLAGSKIFREPAALIELITKHGVSIVQATPSAWQGVMAYAGGALKGITALVGGEPLSLFDAKKLCSLTEKNLMLLYGPTETTVWSSSGDFTPDSRSVVIGRPIRNTSIYVLDNKLRTVATGVGGEIYISGFGVAKGYLNRSGLTAQRFLANPFGPAGSRMYRTGDTGRWLQNGELEFIGRVDNQVKIRGHRIELGEIEAQLASIPGVATAVVIAADSESGQKQLLGYFVTDSKRAKLSNAELRRKLSEVLPSYMVPDVITQLDVFPQTANGKLDRNALPVPYWHASTSRPPSTATECAVCSIFEELLGVEGVAVDDNFFEIGGHSLLAIKAISLLNSFFNIKLPVQAIFEAPTVAYMAARLNSHVGQFSNILLPLRRGGTESPVFCIHPLFGFGMSYAGLLSGINPLRPVYAIQARGFDGVETKSTSMEEMVNDYIGRIMEIQPEGPYVLLGWSFGGVVAHAAAAVLERRGESVSHLIMLDAMLPMKWARIGSREVLRERLITTIGGENSDLLPKETVDNCLDIAENLIAITKNYVPTPYEGNALFLRAAVLPEMSVEVVRSDWSELVGGTLSILDVASEHDKLLDARAATTVARIVNEYLLDC